MNDESDINWGYSAEDAERERRECYKILKLKQEFYRYPVGAILHLGNGHLPFPIGGIKYAAVKALVDKHQKEQAAYITIKSKANT